MRDDHIDLCGQIDFTRTEAMPLLAQDAHFSFACNGCGDCCRGREDIVLSGFDLWRIAARLRLPPQIVARGYCRASIGQVSHLPVLRLAPVKENRSNCPFLTENHCAIHDAEPLVCALYPLAQEISREGQVSYFSAAHRLRRAGDRGPGAGLPVLATTCPAREADRTCAGRRPAWTLEDDGGTVWERSSARCCCAGCQAQALAGAVLPLRLRTALGLAPAGEPTCTGWKPNWAKLTAYQQKRNNEQSK